MFAFDSLSEPLKLWFNLMYNHNYITLGLTIKNKLSLLLSPPSSSLLYYWRVYSSGCPPIPSRTATSPGFPRNHPILAKDDFRLLLLCWVCEHVCTCVNVCLYVVCVCVSCVGMVYVHTLCEVETRGGHQYLAVSHSTSLL